MKKMVLRLTALLLAMLLVVPVSAMATVSKVNLSVNDFSVVMPDHLVYDGTAKSAIVTCQKTDYRGTIIVRYNGSEEAPVNAGEYVVTLECGGDPKYTELKETELARFTIEKAEMPVEPLEIEVCEGDTYLDYELPAGWALAEDYQAVEFWGVGKTYVYDAVYTPEDTVNYKPTESSVAYKVTKAAPITPTPVPTATPAPTAVPETPATGDSANLTVLLAAMMLAGAAMLVLRRRVRG